MNKCTIITTIIAIIILDITFLLIPELNIGRLYYQKSISDEIRIKILSSNAGNFTVQPMMWKYEDGEYKVALTPNYLFALHTLVIETYSLIKGTKIYYIIALQTKSPCPGSDYYFIPFKLFKTEEDLIEYVTKVKSNTSIGVVEVNCENTKGKVDVVITNLPTWEIPTIHKWIGLPEILVSHDLYDINK